MRFEGPSDPSVKLSLFAKGLLIESTAHRHCPLLTALSESEQPSVSEEPLRNEVRLPCEVPGETYEAFPLFSRRTSATRPSPEISAERHACNIETVCRWKLVGLAVLPGFETERALTARPKLPSFTISSSLMTLQPSTSLAKRSAWTDGGVWRFNLRLWDM